jgi:hypothetical protein
MPKKIAFATSEWKNKPGKPESMSQLEWDAYNSSKFSGFPFPVHEKNELGENFQDWDRVTAFEGSASGSSSEKVTVIYEPYSYKFTLNQLFQAFWNMKTAKVSLNGTEAAPNSAVESDRWRLCTKTSSGSLECEISGPITWNPTTGEWEPQGVKKSNELELITHPQTNYWTITTIDKSSDPSSNPPFFTSYSNGSGSQISIDFNQPVLKTGEDEYRPFVYCLECFCAQGAADLAAAGCPILGNFTFTASVNGLTFPILQVDWMNGDEPYIKYFSTEDPEWSGSSPYTNSHYSYSYPITDSCTILYEGVGGGGFSGPEGILFGLNAGSFCGLGPGGWGTSISLYAQNRNPAPPPNIPGTNPLKTIIPVSFSHPSTMYPWSACTQDEIIFYPTLEQLMQGVSFPGPAPEEGFGYYNGPICDGDGNCQYVSRLYTFTKANGGTLYFKIS